MTQKTSSTDTRWYLSAELADGGLETLMLPSDEPCTLTLAPGTGATAHVTVTCSSPAEIAADEALWIAPPAGGDYTAAALLYFLSPITALRVSATGGAASVRLCQGAD